MKTLREMMDLIESAQKTDNRPPSAFDREIIKAYPDGGVELKCGHKSSANLSKNPVGKKIFCGRCYELRNKQDVAEEQLEETGLDPVRRIEELFRDK